MTTVAPAQSRIVKTGPRGLDKNPISDFSGLRDLVRGADLLRRRRGFYAALLSALAAALVGLIVGGVFVGNSWWQLLIAAGLGVVLTQVAFVAHEASHRAVFEQGKTNDRLGRILANGVVGISYSWWMHKHTRHHANPNTLGKDPDVERDVVSFHEADAARSRGLYAWFTKRQGWFFFPLTLGEGVNLYRLGFQHVFGRNKVDGRGVEIAMLVLRSALYFAAVFVLLSPTIAVAFVGVQFAIFGIYMGASFVPNHTGMPLLPKDSKVDFLRRQVLTSRNISGRLTDWFMGGLNYQVEHHLFPSMPRPALARAARIVRRYCAERDIEYTQTSLGNAYAVVVAYLNKVGLAAGSNAVWSCPAAAQFGR